MSRASTPRTSPRSPQSSQQAPEPQQVPMAPAAPSFIRIPDAALADIRQLEVLIGQHTRTIRALERDLVQTVAHSCGVNLDTEHWELDSRHGLIERRDDPSAATTPAAVVPQE